MVLFLKSTFVVGHRSTCFFINRSIVPKACPRLIYPTVGHCHHGDSVYHKAQERISTALGREESYIFLYCLSQNLRDNGAQLC